MVTPDGKPVIIGGLMENRKVDTTRKVPLLGDIPILGNLFKRKVKTDTKTELIIFLTPHIVYYPSQLAALSEKERKNWELANKTFSDKELDKFVDGLPVRTNTVTEVGTPAKKGSSKKSSSTVEHGMN